MKHICLVIHYLLEQQKDHAHRKEPQGELLGVNLGFTTLNRLPSATNETSIVSEEGANIEASYKHEMPNEVTTQPDSNLFIDKKRFVQEESVIFKVLETKKYPAKP